MKHISMKHRKKIVYFLILVLFITSLVAFIYLYFFKPIIINSNVTSNTKINLNLYRRINKCEIKSQINESNDTKVIEKFLINDKYNKNKKVFSKEYYINKSCTEILKKYKEEKLITLESVVLEVNEEYNPNYLNSFYKDIKLLQKADTSKIENQYDVYKIDNFLFNKYLLRKVSVKDTIAPIITLNGKKELLLYINDEYKEEGYNVIDNYDGDLSNNVIIDGNVDVTREGNYTINYTVYDSSGNKAEEKRNVIVKKRPVYSNTNTIYFETKEINEPTYINGILIVNKKYGLPKDYAPNVNEEALKALKQMQADASVLGLNLKLISGYRSYEKQSELYNNYVKKDGEKIANTYSAKPGYSEHQTGLAFDIGKVDSSFANTKEAKWIEENAHLYGFIVRYPKNKTSITGYIYEPWHVRYLGIDTATKVKESGLCLEEYLGLSY